jgi:predicted transcriptional regulator
LQNQLNRREKELLEMLEKIQPASDRDLAKVLYWEIGQVNGRRNALMQKGVVEEAFKAKSPLTNRTVIYWKVNG